MQIGGGEYVSFFVRTVRTIGSLRSLRTIGALRTVRRTVRRDAKLAELETLDKIAQLYKIGI